MKIKTIILLLFVLTYICAQQELKNEDLSTENKTQQETKLKTDRPFILTYDLDTLKEESSPCSYNDQYVRQLVETSINIVKKFFADLLRIQVKTDDFYIVKEEEMDATAYQQFNKFKGQDNKFIESDLHITFGLKQFCGKFIQQCYYQNLVDYQVLREKDQIPTHVKFEMNSCNSQIDSLPEKSTIQVFYYEMIRAIFQIYYQKLERVYNKELQLLELIHPNFKEIATQYFNCDLLNGLPFDQYSESLLEGGIFENEISSSYYNYFQQPYLSIFTITLLKTTNLFTYVNDNMIEYYSYGKDAGCNFMYDSFRKEQLTVILQENGYDQSRCDYHRQSFDRYYSYQDQIKRYNCNMYVDEIRIPDENEIQQPEYAFDDVRCFDSSLSYISYYYGEEFYKPVWQCFYYQCSQGSNQLIIEIGYDASYQYGVCSYNNQQLEFEGYYGYVYCPQNIEEFCSFKKVCSYRYCSNNGYCNNGVCNCLPNYSGVGCEIFTPPVENTPLIENATPIIDNPVVEETGQSSNP